MNSGPAFQKYDTDEIKFPAVQMGLYETGSGVIYAPAFTWNIGNRIIVSLDLLDEDVLAVLETAVNAARGRRGLSLNPRTNPEIEVEWHD